MAGHVQGIWSAPVHQQVSQHCRGPASFLRANPNHRLSSPIKQTKTTTRKPWPPKLTNWTWKASFRDCWKVYSWLLELSGLWRRECQTLNFSRVFFDSHVAARIAYFSSREFTVVWPEASYLSSSFKWTCQISAYFTVSPSLMLSLSLSYSLSLSLSHSLSLSLPHSLPPYSSWLSTRKECSADRRRDTRPLSQVERNLSKSAHSSRAGGPAQDLWYVISVRSTCI